MHPHSNTMLSLFILAALLSIHFTAIFAQFSAEYADCIEPFQCGRLGNLRYPFWGGNRRPPACGFPGFELNCDGDFPLLNISSLSYRILHVDFSTSTLRVARGDLWNGTCTKALRNTTVDNAIFQFPKNSADSDVILYYGCAVSRSRQARVLNEFNCDVDGVTTVNLFDAWSRGLGNDAVCNTSISVPVNRTSALALETPTNSSINVLREALASGFSIQWSADNRNCESCRRSNGICAYNRSTSATVCINQDGGMPPSESPGASPFENGKNGSDSHRVRNIAVVIIAVIGTNVLSVAIVCYLRRRYCLPSSTNQVINQDLEKFLLQHGSLASKRYMYSEIKKITKSFGEKLGQGGYGTVYKGTLRDGSLVAVKVLTETNGDGEEFINEVASISRTSHVNIVNLLGFCYDGNNRALVYEYMPNRSLDKFIGKNRLKKCVDSHLNFDKLYKIAVGVAKGLEYLHTGCNTRIVHFDIKPQNILLDEDFCPKISDFGLAKLCKKKQSALSLLGARGTVGYIAPEIFSRNFGKVSDKSDVYSYGMMLLKMAGANKAVGSETVKSSENYFPEKIYEVIRVEGMRKLDYEMVVEEEEVAAKKLILVGFWCIQTAPSDRPLMSKVVEMLEGSVEAIQIPPMPVLFSPNPTGQEFSLPFSAFTEMEEDSAEDNANVNGEIP